MISVPTRPITNPNAPITNVRRRNSPRAASAAIRQKRSHAWSIATVSRTRDMARPIVSASRATTPKSSVSPASSVTTRRATHTARCASGTCSAMHSTSVTTHAMTMRTVPIARPGSGASSRRRNPSSCGSRGAGSGAVSARAMRQDDQRAAGGSDFPRGPRMIVTAEAPTRKASAGCGSSMRMRTGKRCAMWTQLSSRRMVGIPGRMASILRIHRPADALDGAPEPAARIGHEVHLGRHAGGDAIELRLAVVGQDVPVAGYRPARRPAAAPA